MEKKGIEYLNFIQIDNCLADPCDIDLLAFQIQNQSDIVIKSTFRKDREENVGVIVEKNNRLHVIEYTEIDTNEINHTNEENQLIYKLANLSLFCFKMDFVKKISVDFNSIIPLHLVKKQIKTVHSSNNFSLGDNANYAWKFERFIFDCLSLTSQVKVLVYPRENCFSPLKNHTGKNSLETVQKDLQAYDRMMFKRVSNIDVEKFSFELSPEFYYPTNALLKRWKGKSLPSSNYIESNL